MADLNRYREQKDYKNYEVLIHSTKSNAKMIGFTELSEKARMLEEAAHNSDENYISEHHEEAVRKCKETAELIAELLGIKVPDGGDSVSGDAEVLEFGAGDDEVLEFAAKGGDPV